MAREGRRVPKKGLAKKKGRAGHAVQFMTRNQCIKRLQVSLADFRRLCILKGVYPRDPSKKVKGKDKTYYALKDIQFLMHEPVLAKFRDIKAHAKKVTKARGRKDPFKVQLLGKNKPFYMLDHLVKERFPTFVDAVRDMDDALCMATIFANLPSTRAIETKRTDNCQKLCLEFQTYVSLSHSLRKVFLSIKGCYFQAEVLGQPVTWLVPYEFSQDLPDDVDYRVMLTFLELYETQLRFINYKLFTGLGYMYPPKIDQLLDGANAGIAAIRVEKIGAAKAAPTAADSKPHPRLKSLKGKLSQLERGAEEEGAEEEEEKKETDLNELVGGGEEEGEGEGAGAKDLLFGGLKVFISREVSRKLFEFIARSFGAQVGWEGEGSAFGENDEGITHQIVDRDFQKRRVLSREYVQPQWLADSANAGLLIPVEPYAPGHVPPPHLSPFVDDEEEGYMPDQRKLILSLQEASHRHAGAHGEGAEGEGEEDEEGEEEGSDEEEETEEAVYARELEAERKKAEGDGGEEEEKEEGKEAGTPTAPVSRAQKRKAEEESRQKLMMSKKSKRLYEKIKFGEARKAARVAELESRKA